MPYASQPVPIPIVPPMPVVTGRGDEEAAGRRLRRMSRFTNINYMSRIPEIMETLKSRQQTPQTPPPPPPADEPPLETE